MGNSSAPDKATLCGFTYRMKTGRPCQLAMPRGKYLFKGRHQFGGELKQIKDDDEVNKKGKNNRFRLAKQQLCSCITLFCTFLCRSCTTTTWKCLLSRFVEDREHKKRKFFLLSWTSMQSFRIQLQKKIQCQRLTNWTEWNKRDKVWCSLTSLF